MVILAIKPLRGRPILESLIYAVANLRYKHNGPSHRLKCLKKGLDARWEGLMIIIIPIDDFSLGYS